MVNGRLGRKRFVDVQENDGYRYFVINRQSMAFPEDVRGERREWTKDERMDV
ncbi:MAG: hypothetical protein MN733_00590 [Nitrososphaera sp.]|nr:hypothetical protein [Nitrososphaera sp.]